MRHFYNWAFFCFILIGCSNQDNKLSSSNLIFIIGGIIFFIFSYMYSQRQESTEPIEKAIDILENLNEKYPKNLSQHLTSIQWDSEVSGLFWDFDRVDFESKFYEGSFSVINAWQSEDSEDFTTYKNILVEYKNQVLPIKIHYRSNIFPTQLGSVNKYSSITLKGTLRITGFELKAYSKSGDYKLLSASGSGDFDRWRYSKGQFNSELKNAERVTLHSLLLEMSFIKK